MDTNEKQPLKAVTPQELERRRDEFDVPEGAIAALRAGASQPVVFLRSTGEEYRLVAPEDDAPPAAPRPL